MVQIAVTVLLPVRDVALIRIGWIAIVRRKGDGSGGRTDGGAASAMGGNERAGQDMDKLTGALDRAPQIQLRRSIDHRMKEDRNGDRTSHGKSIVGGGHVDVVGRSTTHEMWLRSSLVTCA
jgi:hypothetical protein